VVLTSLDLSPVIINSPFGRTTAKYGLNLVPGIFSESNGRLLFISFAIAYFNSIDSSLATVGYTFVVIPNLANLLSIELAIVGIGLFDCELLFLLIPHPLYPSTYDGLFQDPHFPSYIKFYTLLTKLSKILLNSCSAKNVDEDIFPFIEKSF